MSFKSVYRFQKYIPGDKLVIRAQSLGELEGYIAACITFEEEDYYLFVHPIDYDVFDSFNRYKLSSLIIAGKDSRFEVLSHSRKINVCNENYCNICKVGNILGKDECKKYCPNTYIFDPDFFYLRDSVKCNILGNSYKVTACGLDLGKILSPEDNRGQLHWYSELSRLEDFFVLNDKRKSITVPTTGVFSTYTTLSVGGYQRFVDFFENHSRIHFMGHMIYFLESNHFPISRKKISGLDFRKGYSLMPGYNQCKYCYFGKSECESCKSKYSVWLGNTENLITEEI